LQVHGKKKRWQWRTQQNLNESWWKMPDVEITITPELANELVEFIGYSGVKKLEKEQE
jgi:hypothetical protein